MFIQIEEAAIKLQLPPDVITGSIQYNVYSIPHFIHNKIV